MTTLVDTGLFKDLQKFGATDVSACFSCGNCTAICPLADNDGAFPRRMIRYAQVGMKEELVTAKELWTCYHCGECSDACPTEADPGEFMATARKYAIASFDRTGLARLLYTKPVASTIVSFVVFLFFAVYLYADHGIMPKDELRIFDFVPEPYIHWTGTAIMVLIAIAGIVGIVTMARGISKREGVTWGSLFSGGQAWSRTWKALWFAVGIESIGQRRYRDDCKTETTAEPLYRRRWLVHALTIWGFLGLLVATSLDYGLSIIGVKETGTPIPLWYPSRLIGTIAGISLLYGVTMFFVMRFKKYNRSTMKSTVSDWVLLTLLWVTGFTGFLIEIALYAPPTPAWGYWVFLIHVAVAMELLIFLPFTKFAHAIYRPTALFFYSLAGSKESVNA